MLTKTQEKVLTYLVEELQKHDIAFQVSGGLAAIAHGATRPLYDIDLEIHKSDVETVRELFRKYITEDWNNDLEGPDDQFEIWMMKLEVDGVHVDISQMEEAYLLSKSGERILQPSEMDTESRAFIGLILPVQRKEPLIAYKKVLARDTDLVDIVEMENTGEANSQKIL